MKYNVNQYYTEPDPVVSLHLNTFAKLIPKVKPAVITASVWDNEGIVHLSNPAKDNIDPKVHAAMPLIKLAHYSISIEVLPPKYKLDFKDKANTRTGIKVLYGAIKDGETWRAPLSVPQFTSASTLVKSPFITAHETLGAVILRLVYASPDDDCAAFSTAADVPVETTLPVSKYGLKLPPLAFIKVSDLPWGGAFEDADFYNLTGFSFRFQGTQTQLAHLQFWTAGVDVNCGVHNHSDAIFQEIHICLSPGTGNGGMARLKDEYVPVGNPDPEELNNLGPEAFDLLTLDVLEEHGGMWERDPYGLPVRDEKSRVVKYPYHKWQAGNESENVDIWAAIEFGVEIDYRVEGIGQVEGARKRVLPKEGLGYKGNRVCTVTHRGAHHGCC